jgi:putative transposase
MAIDKALIDQLLADHKKPEDIIGENGMLTQLTKAILERALQEELTDHLGFENTIRRIPQWQQPQRKQTQGAKRRFRGTGTGESRDRQASFEPEIVARGRPDSAASSGMCAGNVAAIHQLGRDQRIQTKGNGNGVGKAY